MSNEIKKRDGFFKSMKKYSKDDAYKKRQAELRENPIILEKRDKLALIISAFLTIVLPTILILAIMILVPMLFFGLL